MISACTSSSHPRRQIKPWPEDRKANMHSLQSVSSELTSFGDLFGRAVYFNQTTEDEEQEGYWQIDGADENELLFIIPQQNRSKRSSSSVCSRGTTWSLTGHEKTNNRLSLGRGISTRERLVRSQNIWCIPSVSRTEASHLLTNAEVGTRDVFIIYR
ncbi:hypothetical protein PHET_09321 [Paragonimus heterotremus]|uniref:Uncharacterized protein n=1 Tax=Paragonimus heterotremus TaxID=100268 RepID=A0A8J4TAT3_9TREM|nr:hypothetical protein PHET_09321 [Paragonimus heterotremus]